MANERLVKKIYGITVEGTKRKGRPWKRQTDAVSDLIRARGILGDVRGMNTYLVRWSSLVCEGGGVTGDMSQLKNQISMQSTKTRNT